MTLQPIGAGIDYVQDSQPSGANDAEVWLDTSTNPSTIKIYDEDADSWDEAKGEHIDQPISEAGGASKEEVEEAVNDAKITNDIYRAIERRVSEIWSEDSDFDDWTLTDDVTQSGDAVKLVQDQYAHEYPPAELYTEGTFWDANDVWDQDTDTVGDTDETDAAVVFELGSDVHIIEFRQHPGPDADEFHEGDGTWAIEVYDGSEWDTIETRSTSTEPEWSDWISVDRTSEKLRIRCEELDDGESTYIGEIEIKISTISGTATSPAQSPTDISTWELANYDADEDGETVTFDIVDNDDNVLQEDINDGEDISDVSADESVSIRATLSRDDTSNDPTVNSAALRWIE